MNRIVIKNGQVVNEGLIEEKDILIEGEFITQIGRDISPKNAHVIDAAGKYVFPGVIDDQVHFREPGLTHKAEIYTEAKAAVAGGVTTYMEMPNTIPNALTQNLLQQKYDIAAEKSLANYSFYMGASNDNVEEVLKTDPTNVCGVKIFMGSSTGNMLVDNEAVLRNLFGKVPMLIATHCEDEDTVKSNMASFKEKYGEDIPASYHPLIRSHEACYKSSSMAVDLAKEYGTRLHVLHISTAKELELFDNKLPLKEKKVTSEACIHHLYFSDEDYNEKGMFIKWNPAVKTKEDREAIFQAVLDNRIDVIATDHAPHTIEEKNRTYFNAPSGGPLIQHSLVTMFEFFRQGKISLERLVDKMCHDPAILFRVEKRGYIREGNYGDIVVLNPERSWEVNKENILAKCKWSPFEGKTFGSSVEQTIISGHLAYDNGIFNESRRGKRITFTEG